MPSSRSRANATRPSGWSVPSKNRFGSTDEVGVFEMAGEGLLEVSDPARAFLADHAEPAAGSVIAPTMEGSRPLLVEVQALVSPAGYGTPARKASGVDPNRLGLLVAVLARRAGVALGSHDVYANLAGGLTVGEPGLDLPLALALASSLRDRPLAAEDRRHRRGRAARRAARPWPASSDACARPPAWASSRRSCRVPGRGAASVEVPGLPDRGGRHPARGGRGRPRRSASGVMAMPFPAMLG